MASSYLVVGGGITGLVAAYELAVRGLPVLLVECAEIRDNRIVGVTVNGRRHEVSAVISTIPPRELAGAVGASRSSPSAALPDRAPAMGNR